MVLLKQDMNTTRFHVVIDERLLKTDLQSGSYKETLLGFSYQVGIFPRDGKVGKHHRWHGDAQVCFQDSSSFIFLIFFFCFPLFADLCKRCSDKLLQPPGWKRCHSRSVIGSSDQQESM